MMDSAQSLAIGAVTIDPANPTTVWVGTGEGNGNADGFAGVGIYRILNAESASPTLEGPFSTRVAGCGNLVDNGVAFRGTSITRIVFDPNNSARMFVGNSTGVGGIGVASPRNLPLLMSWALPKRVQKRPQGWVVMPIGSTI